MSFYGFEYFCGANVLVKIGGLAVLECAGISYELSESKRPMYGYSSRHFDAVARGQVIIQGTLLINYVHQDYLYRAIDLGIERGRGPKQSRSVQNNLSQRNKITRDLREAGVKAIAEDLPEAAGFIQGMRDELWSYKGSEAVGAESIHRTFNPSDLDRGIDISVVFGKQDSAFRQNGKTGSLLRGVHFLGRSRVIRIDEEVIVEAYPFIARNEFSLRAAYRPIVKEGGPTIAGQGGTDFKHTSPDAAGAVYSVESN